VSPWRDDYQLHIKRDHGADKAEHAMLLVTESNKHGLAKVALLHRYERKN
jgi:hypothetical protein